MTRKEKYLSNILRQLEDFLSKDWPTNLWIENTAIKVYVRQSERYLSMLSNKSLTCLDIANISVAPHYRQQGLFTDFMNKAHEIHSFDMTYVECIRNPLILQWCAKRGWTPHNPCHQESVDCFYLPKHDTIKDKVTITALETSLLSESVEKILLAQEKEADNKRLNEVHTVNLHIILYKLQTLATRHCDSPDRITLQEL